MKLLKSPWFWIGLILAGFAIYYATKPATTTTATSTPATTPKTTN